ECVILKRRRDDDDDQGEGPSARPDRGSKRQRKGKDPKSAHAPLEPATRSIGRSTTGSKSRQASASESAFAEEPVQTTSQIEEPSHQIVIGTRPCQLFKEAIAKQAESRSSFNELLDTPIDFSNFIMNWLGVDTLTPKLLARPTYELMKGSCKSLTELEYHLEEVYKATTDQLDWINPKGQQYPHNLLQPIQLILDNRGCRVIPFAHFINNDLEYLRGGASSRKYTTSVTKTKAADYGNIKWIEDLVPRSMWIQEPINYDKHALWGVSHWGWKRQQFYGFAVNRESTLDVYSKRRIIAVTDLKIDVYKEYRHPAACGRSSTGSRKLPEEAQPYQARHDKKNRLMRIDELHKFSDETLNDVRNALDDRLKGIRMQYLPQTIWRKGDKDKAAAMIQAIDKMLKARRIMRSLERFVGGRLKPEVNATELKPHSNEVGFITTCSCSNDKDILSIKIQESRKLNHKDKVFHKLWYTRSSSRFQVYQGRLSTSFQDVAKYEHGGQDTRLQGGKDDQDEKDKDLKISNEKTKSKDNHKWQKIKDHKA
nr:hypothetical protein [Tanacetum cinerariifolium]